MYADWNDCLRFGPKGESIFVSLQLRFALAKYMEVCALLRQARAGVLGCPALDDLDRRLEKYAWDGQWYLRGYGDDGQKYGSK